MAIYLYKIPEYTMLSIIEKKQLSITPVLTETHESKLDLLVSFMERFFFFRYYSFFKIMKYFKHIEK